MIKPPINIKSSERTLAIFELFADLRRPARVNELHRRLDLPQSSVSKLLQNLARRGYLQYDPATRSYSPTLRVTLLGSWLQAQWFGHDSLLATMERIRSTLGTSVLLGVQNDKHVLYMVALEALVNPRPALAIGTLRPICLAGVGKALMMGKSRHEAELLIRRINAEEPDPSRYINVGDFMAEMEQSRTRGYALSDGVIVAGTKVLAMPLPKLDGQPAMAMGVGASAEWIEENLDLAWSVLRSSVGMLDQAPAQEETQA